VDPLLLVPTDIARSSRYDTVNYIELNINVGKSILTVITVCINTGSWNVTYWPTLYRDYSGAVKGKGGSKGGVCWINIVYGVSTLYGVDAMYVVYVYIGGGGVTAKSRHVPYWWLRAYLYLVVRVFIVRNQLCCPMLKCYCVDTLDWSCCLRLCV
jgi:hypothetical protein